MEINGKRILITGAANGIGKALALQLHEQGARVALLDVDYDKLKEVALSCGNAPYRQCDVSNLHQVTSTITALADKMDGFDVVIANAGIAARASILGHPEDPFDRVMDVNVKGTHNTVKVAGPRVARGGYIMVTSSLGAAVNFPMMAAYSASKAAIEAYGSTLRIEMKGTNIRVGTAFYAQLDTEMTKQFDCEEAEMVLGRRGLHLLHQVTPLQPAINAIIRGIKHRSAIVVAPRRARLIRLFRAPIQWVAERWIGDIQDALEVHRQRALEEKQMKEKVSS